MQLSSAKSFFPRSAEPRRVWANAAGAEAYRENKGDSHVVPL